MSLILSYVQHKAYVHEEPVPMLRRTDSARGRFSSRQRSAFVFDDRHGVKAYVRKLKGVLMWQFSLLEQVKILSFVECSSCLLAIQHVPLPM